MVGGPSAYVPTLPTADANITDETRRVAQLERRIIAYERQQDKLQRSIGDS